MNWTVKISRDKITLGPTEPCELQAPVWALKLEQDGYRRTSNAFCTIGRIDRPDWIDVLALNMNCCNADFYMKDGSGPSEAWKSHYIRRFTTDKHTVAPEISRKIRSA
jgi:hypothetical protein